MPERGTAAECHGGYLKAANAVKCPTVRPSMEGNMQNTIPNAFVIRHEFVFTGQHYRCRYMYTVVLSTAISPVQSCRTIE